jgi:hypothetical protein
MLSSNLRGQSLSVVSLDRHVPLATLIVRPAAPVAPVQEPLWKVRARARVRMLPRLRGAGCGYRLRR